MRTDMENIRRTSATKKRHVDLWSHSGRHVLVEGKKLHNSKRLSKIISVLTDVQSASLTLKKITIIRVNYLYDITEVLANQKENNHTDLS